MQEFIERLSPKIKKNAKKALWIFASFIAFLIIVSDFDKPGGGYIQLVFTWGLSTIIAGYIHTVEIANTPLADLTIAKIVGLMFYAVVGIILFHVGRGILSWGIKKLFGFGESE